MKIFHFVFKNGEFIAFQLEKMFSVNKTVNIIFEIRNEIIFRATVKLCKLFGCQDELSVILNARDIFDIRAGILGFGFNRCICQSFFIRHFAFSFQN